MPILDYTKSVRIMTPNFIDINTTITSSHGGTTSYLWDRDRETKWTTTGAAAKRDETTATLTFTFKVGSTETEFTANNLILINTNANLIILEKWNGSAWAQVFQANISAEDDYGCWTFGAVTTSRMRISIVGTKTPNEQKYIGEVVICRLRKMLSTGMSEYRQSFRQKISAYEVADGGLQIAYTRAPGSRTNRYGATATFTLLPREDYEFLLCLKNEGQPFLWYPEAVVRPDEVWYVNWTNPFTAQYTTFNTATGYTIVMDLSEV